MSDLASTQPTAAEHLDLNGNSMLSVLWRAYERHGDVCRVYAPAIDRHVWLLSDPRAVHHVLVAQESRENSLIKHFFRCGRIAWFQSP
jgi:hypothetical protein